MTKCEGIVGECGDFEVDSGIVVFNQATQANSA